MMHKIIIIILCSLFFFLVEAEQTSNLINISIKKELSQKSRIALESLTNKSQIQNIIINSIDNAVSLESLCSIGARCPAKYIDDATISAMREINILNYTSDKQMTSDSWSTLPIIQTWDKNYAVIDTDKVEYSHIKPLLVKSKFVAVPINNKSKDSFYKELALGNNVNNMGSGSIGIPVIDDPFTVYSATYKHDVSLRLIDGDIKKHGFSSRVYEIRDDLSESQLNEIIDILDREDVSYTFKNPTELISSIDYFELDKGSKDNCMQDDNYPFSVESVRQLLEFNNLVHSKLDVSIKRASILIVDSGIDKALLESSLFNKIIYLNKEKLMNRFFVKKNNDEVVCLNTGGEISDVIGASGFDNSRNVAQKCNELFINKLDPLVDYRLFPAPKKALIIENYTPSHGSFVAGLAAGGPAMLEQEMNLKLNIGLRFYKVTRPAPSNSKSSVYIDSMDYINAIKYGIDSNIDVINMSFKTTDINFADWLSDNKSILDTTILVTSAGNSKENLDSATTGNFPASLMNDQLLVVGSLKKDNITPWELSAYSPTKVHILAPGEQVLSYGDNGKKICMSGTSASAPLVAFTAALLKSFGLNTKETIERIKLSADENDKLNKLAEFGRILNIKAALDVFVDQVITTDDKLIRGRIFIPSPKTGFEEYVLGIKEGLIDVCDDKNGQENPLITRKGFIDPISLKTWERKSDDLAIVQHVLPRILTRTECSIPTSYINIRLQGEPLTTRRIQMGKIKKIIMSPFRADLVTKAVLSSEL